MDKDTTVVNLFSDSQNNCKVLWDNNRNCEQDSVKINGLEEVEETLTKTTKVKDEVTKHKKDKDRDSNELHESHEEIKGDADQDEIDSRRHKNDSFEELQEEINEEEEAKLAQKASNNYAAKKTVAQGMMDIALITANANQLRYIIEFNKNSSTYYLNLTLIVISLLLQVAVGVSLIFKGRMDLRGESKHQNAKRINNYVVVGVFLVTIINVFIASFTITGSGSQ
ncbi:ninjurin-B-like [Aethina tumida]|uniref:ninjurin-B-like n=1 Tax=Aethina tumida TaxID=116153 RepID=UPI002147E72D|nr:ninjurin-B-like [Aethina tumida]